MEQAGDPTRRGRSVSSRVVSAAVSIRSRRQAIFPGPIRWSYIVMVQSPTSRANPLATSTTMIDEEANRKAFVILRFAGDDLDPAEISAILPVEPTRAHRKGEEFFAGAHAGKLRGRTGMWFLATDKFVRGDNLRNHLAFVQKLLYPAQGDCRRIAKLGNILRRTHSRAHITCFWRGEPGEPAPEIPDRFTSAIEPLAADIETDFVAAF